MKMQKCQTLKGKVKRLNRLCIRLFVLPQFWKRNTDILIGILAKKQTAVVGTPQKQGSRVDCHVTCQVKVNCKGYCAF